jgi:hypothetical protein
MAAKKGEALGLKAGLFMGKGDAGDRERTTAIHGISCKKKRRAVGRDASPPGVCILPQKSAVGKFAAGETGSGIGGLHPWPAFNRRIDLKQFLSCRPIRPAFPYTADRPCGTARSGISAPDMRSPVSGLASPVDLGHRLGRKHVDRYWDECDVGFDHCGRDMALDLHHEPAVARIEACWSRRTQRNAQPRCQASQGQHHC